MYFAPNDVYLEALAPFSDVIISHFYGHEHTGKASIASPRLLLLFFLQYSFTLFVLLMSMAT
jgi:hypothetical protein